MLRVMRLRRSDLPPMWEEAAKGLPALINSLGLPTEAKSLIAERDEDGDFINFHSIYEGSLEQVPIYQGKPIFPKNRMQAEAHFNERRELIMQHLEPILAQEAAAGAAGAGAAGAVAGAGTSASASAAAASAAGGGAGSGAGAAGSGSAGVGVVPSAAQMLKTLLMYPQHLIILNETMPVIVPCFNTQHMDEVAKAEAAAAAAAAAAGGGAAAAGGRSHWGCIAGAIALLLLALAAAWYFWKLWPWPFVDEAELAKQQEIAALEKSLAEDEALLSEIDDLIEKTDLRLELAEEINRGDELAKLQEQLAQDEANLEEIDKLIAQVDPKIDEAIKAEAEEAKAAEAAAKDAAAAEAKKAAASETTLAQGKKLPKCSYIKKEGKIPQLVIATDGSGSMLNAMSDRTIRIDAAIKAAHALVDNVDKNVPIRLFGIQGCPLARDYGVFSGGQRSALKRAISNTDPRLVRGMLPIQVLTPLVSALRGMANSVPRDVDSVGILISDGVDTCDGTEDLNICSVAREIHSMRPKLKVNVILIGHDADEAKCIASITGGKVYRPSDSVQLKKDLKSAGTTLQKVCE